MNTHSQKKKILLIDDDTSLLVTLSDFLMFEGYDVITADSGEEGLRSLESTTPDLIVLDMSMPGMGGIGFLRKISNLQGKPDYPVLVLTARANMAEFFADVDVDGFVAKPCDPGDLLMEISRILFLRGGTTTTNTGQDISRKVLIGETNERDNEALVSAFADAGFTVVSVFRGPDVLERAIVEKPDAIVLRQVLHGMNGDAVARILHEMPNTRSIPVILYGAESKTAPENTRELCSVRAVLREADPDAVLSFVETAMESHW
jgi:two-component system NtrC family sensor kinase